MSWFTKKEKRDNEVVTQPQTVQPNDPSATSVLFRG